VGVVNTVTFFWEIWKRYLPAGRETPPRKILLLLSAILAVSLAVGAADEKTELTLREFRALVLEQAAGGKAPVPQGGIERSRERAEEVFLRLLAAQGKGAAASQSLDRLTGWHKVALARLQAQSASAVDVELLRFSELRAAATLAGFEAERRQAAAEANALLRRPPDSALVALPDRSTGEPPERVAPGKKEEPRTPESGAPASDSPQPPGNADIAARKAQFEKELLPAGSDLLAKMYQSYLFGGIPLTALLWQEQQVYRTELDYRLLLVEAERQQKQ